MEATRLNIPDLIVFQPKIFSDERGFFFESYNKKQFEKVVGRSVNFVQDNHSFSSKGTLRGIHYQYNPYAQGKLVRVLEGEVLDVAVDLRTSSPTFGDWASVLLNGSDNKQFWIPEGFGHAFIVLSKTAHFLYKTTNFYNKESEQCIIWNDRDLNIDWNLRNFEPLLSSKDLSGVKFSDAVYFE